MKTITNDLSTKRSGLKRLFVGLLLLTLWMMSTSAYAQVTQTFSTSGSFVVPAGVTTVSVEAWGGGGAGGGNTTTSDGGGGGGGGAYSKSTNISVTTASSFTVTVGNGGTASTGDGGAGGDSWFGATTTLLAKGGTGGISGTLVSGAAGGTGGAIASGVGATKFAGGNGGAGRSSNTGQGGPGGSSAGTAANGVSAASPWTTVTSGTAPTGGGKGGNGGTSGANGSAGAAPGAGGGGSGDGTNSIDVSGGAGAAGKVNVTFTCPTYALTNAATATGPFCGASASVVTLRSSSMPTGTYTVTYNLTGGTSATGNTATMTFTAGSPGTGTFTTSSLTASATATTITVTGISSGITGGLCTSSISSNNTASVTVTIAPTATAGTAIATCSNSGAVNITTGSSAANNAGTTWTSSGTGTFANANSLTTCTYTPSAADITAGSVTLTLTATGNGTCGNATSTKTLTINTAPVSVAGNPVTTCSSTGAVNITSGASASNQASVNWTSSGTGTFANPTSLTTCTYTPSALDISNGGVTLTLTAVGNSGCSNVTSTKSLTITAAATAVAGTAISTCSNSGAVNITAGSSAANNAGITWTSNGTGTFTNANSLTLCTYTPSAADIAAGSRTLTLTATGNSPCGNITSTKTITISTLPTSVAGNPVTTCSSTGAVNITSGASASNQASVNWTSSGTGTFANATSLTTCTYTPSATDISNGGVTLTLTAVANAGCSNVTSTKSLTITAAATAVAGTAITTCATSGAVNITAGSSATNNAGITWTCNGTGTFTNPNSLTLCTYTPSAADISAGSRTLTLTSTGNSPCGNVTSTKTLTINAQVTVNAGNPVATCSYSGAVNITSGATASNQQSVQWSSSGTGTFANATSLTTCTYNPSAADIAAGSVTLTLTGIAKTGCSNVTSNKTMTITSPPAAPGTITGSVDVCQAIGGLTYSIDPVAGATAYTWTVPTGWTINSGQGTTEITVTSGSAGQNGNIVVTATNSCGGTNPSVTYTSNINPLNATNNTGYTTFSAKTSGDIHGTSGGNRGYAKFPLGGLPSNAVITGATLTVVNNNSTTLSTASNDITALGNNDPVSTAAFTLWSAVASGTAYNSSTWSNVGSLVLPLGGTATADIQSRMASPGYLAVGFNRGGSADYIFYGYTGGANAPKLTVTYTLPRQMSVIVNAPATAVAGTAVTTCSNSGAVNITAGSSASNNAGTLWTSSGTGTLANANSLTTCTYNPSAADITAGSVTLTLSATANSGCTNVSSSKTLTINQATTVAAGPDFQICQGATATMAGSFGGGATAATWTTSGTGGFSNNTGTAVYTPSAADIAAGSVTLTYTSNAPTACVTAVDTMVLTIHPTPTVTNPGTQNYCNGSAIASLALTGGPSGVTYDISGGATVGLADVTGATAIPAFTATTGNATVTITPKANGCIGNSISYAINVNPVLTPTFNSVADICAGTTLSPLPTTSLNGVTGSWTPALDNNNTTTYTFHPTAGQCTPATLTTLTIVVNHNTTYYADADSDGYGDAANSMQTCLGQPAGYVTDNTDCDPSNGALYRTGNFYVDNDMDGYNNGAPAEPICYGTNVPDGYIAVNNGTDCNDFNAEVNVWHVEVLANGIDDNCDGQIDEVGPTSVVHAAQCGTTLQNLATTIYAAQVPSATGFRFEVTQGANVRTYDTTVNRFSLLNLPGGALYATTYNIRVAVQVGGFWQAYGAVCSVTTPASADTTHIIDAQCGTTLTNIAGTIYCNQVTAANQYRFEVSDGVNPVVTYDSSVNRFSLTNIPGGASYATTYAVRVALRFGTTWMDFGPSCNLTTPLTPDASHVIPSQCGITISNSWTSIYAIQVAEATGYRFEVVNGATTRYFDTPNARFNLHNLAGAAPAASTTYTIRVAILYNSVYQPFGPACSITTAAAITRQAETAVAIFDVKAYPNPYADAFRLDLNTSSEETVQVKVYDMLGREIETAYGNVTDVISKEVGSNYPSGVYNVIVSQGDKTKTLRVVKR